MRVLSLLALLFVSSSVYAANGNGGGGQHDFAQFFTLASNDQAYVFLNTIFGQVGGVMSGTEGLLGDMFQVFNEVMLVLNTIVIGYASIMGVVSTAQEGEFLGKKFSSIWVPIRAVAGIGLLIPTASGYCILQIIVMWIVLQGVGAADTLWKTVVTTLEKNRTHPTAQVSSNVLTTQAQNEMTNLFVNFVCMHLYYQSDNPKATVQSDQKTYSTYTGEGGTTYYFSALSKQKAACGTFSIANADSTSSAQYFVNKAVKSKMPDILKSLNYMAKQFVYNCDGDPGKIGSCNITGDPVGTAAQTLVQQAQEGEKQYVNSLSSQSLTPVLNQAVNNGWVYAGAFYYKLSSLYAKEQSAGTALLNNIQVSNPNPHDPVLDNWLQQNIKSAIVNNPDFSQITPGARQLTTISDVNLFGGSKGISGEGTGFKGLTNWIVDAFVQMITNYQGTLVDGHFFHEKGHRDPIMGLQALGENIVNITELLFTIIFALLLVVFVASFTCITFNPVTGIGMVFILGAFVPLIVLSMLFVSGLTLSVYVPLIPYLIYFFGVLGWLIAVIESMLAAPMVAMGLTHPEGHEVYGRAEPAVMLMTNVFTRPVFMLFGLISGMLLARVALTFLNDTFSFVILLNSGAQVKVGSDGHIVPKSHTSGYGVGPFQLVLYIIIYVSTIIVLVNKCFALIHIIPDQVLRWIGNQHSFGEYSKGEEEVSGMAKAGAGEAGGVAGKMAASAPAAAAGAHMGGKMAGKASQAFSGKGSGSGSSLQAGGDSPGGGEGGGSE